MKTEMNKALENELLAFAPEIAERWAHQVRIQFRRLLEKFGPTMRGAGSDWRFARIYRSISPFMKAAPEAIPYRVDQPLVLDEEKVMVTAKEFAEAVCLGWLGKINAKIAEIENPEVSRFGGNAFRVIGMKDGKKVVIEQQMILNVSKNGLLFNQFPARIYVDGKFVPASKYQAALAA